MPDCISRREYRTPQSTARTIQRGIIEAVKSYIRQRANKLTLTFDFERVKNMLTFIGKNEYDVRNYTYTDDWALTKFREESEFIKLKEEQKKIEFVDLRERECEAFLEDSKGYNGLYNVDGALMSKEEAMKCTKESYCKERYF